MPKVQLEDLLADAWTAHDQITALSRRASVLRDAEKRYTGDLYRFVAPKWAGENDRLSGMGAKQYGGRWNPAGLAAVYGATTPMGAAAESFEQANRYGFRADQTTPRVVFAFHVKLRSVLDLTDGNVRTRLKTSRKRMIRCRWKRSRTNHHEQLTQAIGRAVAAAGFEAMLVPSARDDVTNLVLFPDLLRTASEARTINADQLDA